MKCFRTWLLAFLLADMILVGVARAQDETPTPPAPVMVHVTPDCAVDDVQPFALCVESTVTKHSGSFAGVSVHLLIVDGQWTRLTPCDDIAVDCAPMTIRVADVAQGDVYILTPAGS